jgi:hypothetical protein
MRVEKLVEKAETPLARALRENFLTIKDLHRRMAEIYYPCPQRYQIYRIVNGEGNLKIITYMKILNALNTMLADPYELGDIVDKNIDEKDKI